MKTTPKLSIFMPVYNLPDLTKRALDSIPFDEDLEVIVVDDGSTDPKVMDVYKEFEGKIKLFKNGKNMNVGYSRNVALDNCTGEYVFGLDNDDYLYTDEFRKAMKELDGTDVVFINQRVNGGFVFELCEENKYHYCAFWTKFVRREFIGDTRCIGTNRMDDYWFTKDIMAKPHTEKYTGIVAYHYNFPREGSILWNYEHSK